MVLTAVAFSVLAGAACLAFTDQVLAFLGAGADTWDHARQYITVLLCFMPMSMLQCLFQSFLVTAGRPGLGLGLTVGAGFANMVLDYVFIVPLGMGIAGAALATAIGYCIPALGGLWFFSRNRSGLRFTRPRWDFTVLLKSCANGASEMVTNLASSIITVIFNLILMAWIGTDGVAAITVIMYAQFLMVAFFMGFSIGVAPVFGFHYGAGNHQYLLRIRDRCIRFVLGASVVVCVVSFLSSGLIAVIFAPEGSLTAQLVNRGMRLFSLSFLFAGYNIFASALFTALSDGRTSALISFARTFFFILVGIWLMTTLLGLDGLWLAIPFAELVTAGLSFYMIRTRFLADAQKMDE
ncbi:MAG: MATE family efflux transporter [Acutalibacteraceae bacterium]